MKRIRLKILSHSALEDRIYPGKHPIYSNKEVRESKPLDVMSYRELVKCMAYISFHNRDFSIFFRGQAHEYSGGKENGVYIYPSIYRNERGRRILKDVTLKKRFEKLKYCGEELINSSFNFRGKSKLSTFKELSWAVLQHYGVCYTPLLDITHSLQAACSFALNKNEGNYGYVYMFGLPHINGSISYYVEEDMLNIKLLSICPPEALRPYFQDGYLIGDFPIKKHGILEQNFSRRLISKFKIHKNTFWDDDFKSIPDEALFPNDDEIIILCESIRKKAEEKYGNA
jgi:hypothetical protein